MTGSKEAAPDPGTGRFKDPLWIGVAVCVALFVFQIAQFALGTSWGGGNPYGSYRAHVKKTRASIDRIQKLAASNDPDSLDEILEYLWDLTGAEIARAAGYGGRRQATPWSYTSSIAADRGPVDLLPHIADALATLNHPETVDALIAVIDSEGDQPAGRHAAEVLAMLCDSRAGPPLLERYLAYSKAIEPFLRYDVEERDADLKTRARILAVLVRCAAADVIRLMSTVVFEDNDPFRKFLAVVALAEIDDPRTLPAILEASVMESGLPEPVNDGRRSYAGEHSRWEAEERVYAAIRERAQSSAALRSRGDQPR